MEFKAVFGWTTILLLLTLASGASGALVQGVEICFNGSHIVVTQAQLDSGEYWDTGDCGMVEVCVNGQFIVATQYEVNTGGVVDTGDCGMVEVCVNGQFIVATQYEINAGIVADTGDCGIVEVCVNGQYTSATQYEVNTGVVVDTGDCGMVPVCVNGQVTSATQYDVNTGIVVDTGDCGMVEVCVNGQVTSATQYDVNTGVVVDTGDCGMVGVCVNGQVTSATQYDVNTGVVVDTGDCGMVGVCVNGQVTSATQYDVNTGVVVDTGDCGMVPVCVNGQVTSATQYDVNAGVVVDTGDCGMVEVCVNGQKISAIEYDVNTGLIVDTGDCDLVQLCIDGQLTSATEYDVNTGVVVDTGDCDLVQVCIDGLLAEVTEYQVNTGAVVDTGDCDLVQVCIDGLLTEVTEYQVNTGAVVDTGDCDLVQICLDGFLAVMTQHEADQISDTGDCDLVRICVNGRHIEVTEYQVNIGEIADTGDCEPSAPAYILSVLGSGGGAGGPSFRTSLHLFNDANTPMSGELSGGGIAGKQATGVTLHLEPRETQYIEDVMAFSGLTGSASADLRVTQGEMPVSVVHVYNDGGDQGTSGLLQRLVPPSRVLLPGNRAVLIAPADPVATRMNIGVRSLQAGLSLRLTVRDAAGVRRAAIDRAFAAATFAQSTAADMLGIAPGASDSITIEVLEGSGIVYASAIDNRTNDPDIQFASLVRDANEQTAVDRVIPLAVSGRGAFGWRFKTTALIHNAGDGEMTASLTFRTERVATPSFTLPVPAHGTTAIDDMLPAMGVPEGIGTLDLATHGSVEPIALVRVCRVSETGELSATEEPLPLEAALDEGETGTILATHDLTRMRFEIAVRTLADGATVDAVVRDATGSVVRALQLTYPPNWFAQTSAEEHLGMMLSGDESLTYTVIEGSAFFCGIWTDDITQDPGLHFATPR